MNAPLTTLADYESERAIRNMNPVYRRTCYTCRGVGFGGHDGEYEFVSTGICRRCGGLGYVEIQQVNTERKSA